MRGLDRSTDNAAGKAMIDRSQINKALKLGAFVQPQAKNKRRGWENKIMCCVWASVGKGIDFSGMGPSSEEQVVTLRAEPNQ